MQIPRLTLRKLPQATRMLPLTRTRTRTRTLRTNHPMNDVCCTGDEVELRYRVSGPESYGILLRRLTEGFRCWVIGTSPRDVETTDMGSE